MARSPMNESDSTFQTRNDDQAQPVSRDGKRTTRLVRVRKDRDGASGGSSSAESARINLSVSRAMRGAGVLYILLLVLRFIVAFGPGVVDLAETSDGVDILAAKLLPGLHPTAGKHVALPQGMVPPSQFTASTPPNRGGQLIQHNYTRSIVGAFVTSGIPYMAVNVMCTKIPAVGSVLCGESMIGYVALYAPRIWMFLLSLIGDVLLVKVFAVYQSEHGSSALLTYASTWMTLTVMSRNTNFALEALCLLGLFAACFGWTYKTPRPLFWLSATSLALGIFLRPVFAVFVCTPLIYMASLWGKNGVDALRYVRAAIEGLAVFAFWVSLWISVDSLYYGSFRLRFGDIDVTSFEMFVDYAIASLQGKAQPLNYKGSLIFVPLKSTEGILTKSFWNSVLRQTSPGQIFVQLPVVLGPLTIALVKESIEGMKTAVKELMTEMKSSSSSDKKGKKRQRGKKPGQTKEREDELLVYYDTIQTTLLLGLLLEVMQSNDRIGLLSLLSLNAPAVICIAHHVFGPASMRNLRYVHFAYAIGMAVFYGVLHHAGISRTLLAAGSGGVPLIKQDSDLVLFRGKVGHPTSVLGANVKNIRVHHGGYSRLELMNTLRDLKGRERYDPDRLLVCAAGTVPMKSNEFELVGEVGRGHMSVDDLPENIDEALSRSNLHMYKFVGDEDEAIIRDNEEAAEEEEEEYERKQRRRSRNAL